MTIVAIGAIAVLIVIVIVAALVSDSGPRMSGSPVYGHLEQFQSLADEHGDRAAGTPGYEAAAQYVEQQLEEAGYESDRQYFTFEARGEEIETFNIIAETDAGSGEDVIMLGAHLDGVTGSPAINDNATGSAALLEAARAVGTQEEVNTTVRFAWWGAEEFRPAHGSGHYVEGLVEGDTVDSIKAYLNFDMVASPNPVIGVYNARDTDTSLDIPDGSRDIMRFFADYFDSREQPWVPTTWSMASDQRAFIDAGVPVGGLFTGSNGRMTHREADIFGGVARAPRDPNYHTPDDDIDNVHVEALDVMTDAITHAATTLAEDSSALELHDMSSAEHSGTRPNNERTP